MDPSPDREHRTLLLGLGNDLLSDDGVGLCAARRVADLIGHEADFTEAGVATIDLLDLMSGYRRVVIIDAFLAPDLTPGTAVRATPDDLPPGFGYRSFHTLTFREVLDIGEWLGVPLPTEVIIHGLSVEEITTFGEGFSPRVAAAWKPWADAIAREEFGVDAIRSSKGRRSADRPQRTGRSALEARGHR